jgi:hypothetical protein
VSYLSAVDSGSAAPACVAGPHLQGDEPAGPHAHAAHPPGPRLRLERPAQLGGPPLRRKQDQKTASTLTRSHTLCVLVYTHTGIVLPCTIQFTLLSKFVGVI